MNLAQKSVRRRAGFAINLVLCLAGSAWPEAAAAKEDSPDKATVALLEDHPEPLLDQLQGQDGGQSAVETRDVFSGASSVKITPMQRFGPAVAGWAFRVREHPGRGEYRYLRFAWRADGARGIMLQFHDERDWNIRYTAGLDEPNWGSKFVAPAPPAKWALVTRDLFADFGDRELRGIALTVFGGTAGYFDHVYLGRTVEDLDRVDAAGRDGPPQRPPDDELARMWWDLGGQDAARSYAAFWALVHAPRQSVPFLRDVLCPMPGEQEGVALRQWVADLGAADYPSRQAAERRLLRRREAAAPLLRAALLDPDLAPEPRLRVGRLLEADAGRGNAERVRLAVRALRFIDTGEAKRLLEDLATADPGGQTPTQGHGR